MTERNYQYNIVWTDGKPVSVTVFDPATTDSMVATSDHPEFDPILLAIRFAEPLDAIKDLFDKGKAINRKFKRLSERVSVRCGTIYFDGIPVHNALVEAIVRAHDSGEEDFMPLVNFMEKVETNPNPHSTEHLYRWLKLNSFSIAADGDFIGYKGVRPDFLSLTAGQAIVDGDPVNGCIPNLPGSIIEMPRDEVTFDPANGCSTGLHAATYAFARGFGTKVVSVKINPRDVVSVPVDSGDAKLRVCRYQVLEEVHSPLENLLFHDEASDPDFTDEDAEITDYEDDDFYEDDEPIADLIETYEAAVGENDDDAPAELVAQPQPSQPPSPEPATPVEFRKPDFERLSHQEMRSIAKKWGLKTGRNPSKTELVPVLAGEARRLRKNRARPKKS